MEGISHKEAQRLSYVIIRIFIFHFCLKDCGYLFPANFKIFILTFHKIF